MYRGGHGDLKTVARYQHTTAERDADLASPISRNPIVRLADESTRAHRGKPPKMKGPKVRSGLETVPLSWCRGGA